MVPLSYYVRGDIVITTRHFAAAATVVGLLLACCQVPATASPGDVTICVGPGAGCVKTMRAALAHAHDGDTIKVAAGSYAGGFTVTKSVRIVGSGRRKTTIRGGGPVITIKANHGAEPSVTIASLTVAGGSTAGNGFVSTGGGIDIPAGRHQGVGARVILRRVTVRDNEATATRTSPSPSGVKCPHGFCPFAQAAGGGIANFGRLTLVDSTVARNRLDGRLSDADGAGIFSATGSLTLRDSVVNDNAAEPKSIGRFAEGGGLFVGSGALTITGSKVINNRADLVTSWPVKGQGTLIDMNANSGGVHIGDGVSAVISHAVISHNTISAIDPSGEPLAFDAALLAGDSTVHMTDTSVRHNADVVKVSTTADVGPSGTAVEFDGPATVAHSSVVANHVTVRSPHGVAAATAGVAVYDFSNNPRQVTLTDMTIAHNSATAISAHGSAAITGVGILNNSLLDLVGVRVRHNTGTATGPTSSAQGGGIWNGVLLSGPPVTLAIHHSRITKNMLTVGTDGSAQGGGLYTTVPVHLDHVVIAHNRPDNCHGCS
jgi:hypothetical protein